MRYLNRIVFINSAMVGYADIPVDGNVHFIGTQGVGKSTVLRALLFFYNADKMKLGISREKKSFDEYYFPYMNSYIIYEVVRDESAYLVMAFRSQGRVCFRFLDTPYSRDFFISPECKAFDEWGQIREAIGKRTYYSRKIDKYEEYRDIIFGNNKGLSVEFRKFAITESNQYQNIPRTIQNVFLNSKLDAAFIKDTIIMSLHEENAAIDLMKYRDHLKTFEEEYRDICKWYEKNKEGRVPVRLQAVQVIDIHRALLFMEEEKRELAACLNFAFRTTGEELPVLERQLTGELARQKKLTVQLDELDTKYREKQIQITSDIKSLNERLLSARELKKKYEQLRIEEIEARVSTREEVLHKRSLYEEQLRVLTDRFTHIRQKYMMLEEQEKAQSASFKNRKETEILSLQQQLMAKKDELRNRLDILLREIREQEAGNLVQARQKVDLQKEELNRLAIGKVELNHRSFYRKEMDTCREERSELQETNRKNNLQRESCNRQIKSITREWELELKAGERELDLKLKDLQRQAGEVERQIAATEALLKSRQGSLYEWLDKEYAGWEDTIGKVIDEKQILFHTGLEPQKTDEKSTSMYGVRLNLAGVDKPVKTIRDYEEELAETRKALAALKKEQTDLDVFRLEEEDRLKKKYQPRIKADKEEIVRLEYQTEQNLLKIQELDASLITWQKKAMGEKTALLVQADEEIRRTTAARLDAEAAFEKLTAQLDKRLKQKEKEFRLKISDEEIQAGIAVEKFRQEISVEHSRLNTRLSLLQQAYQDELSGGGADTERIGVLTKEIALLDHELQFIENNRALVIEYLKDRREVIDRMEEFRSNKQTKEKELDEEKGKYELKRVRLNRDQEELSELLRGLNRSLSELREDIQQTGEFTKQEYCPAEVGAGEEKETRKRCKTLIEELTRGYYRMIEREKNLREAVNRFTGNFSEQNTFHFRIRLTTQLDFMDFASDLGDFIENDVISDFEKRTNKAYTDIIRQIGKEVTDMMSREGAILQVIKDINNDFKERNFAGVIKSILLRDMPSENRIMQLMQTIRDFNDEHLFSLGTFDLFSDTQEKQEENNRKAVGHLQSLVKELGQSGDKELTLSDSFDLQFRIVENDNDSGWVEKLANVGSDGTDVLVKAMINIMLLNVFKEKASRRFSDFRLHCMMDEIGKLHPNNIKGILNFANSRNILLVNCSPTSYRATDYRYTYILHKDNRNITLVKRLIRKDGDL